MESLILLKSKRLILFFNFFVKNLFVNKIRIFCKLKLNNQFEMGSLVFIKSKRLILIFIKNLNANKIEKNNFLQNQIK